MRNRKTEARPPDEDPDGGTPDLGQPGTLKVLYALAVPPVLAVLVYGIAKWSASTVAVAALLASGVFTLGALLGFLFGIPRTLTADAGDQSSTDGGIRHLPNTNLEQISDWLTKILVGVGLVQLGQIRDGVGDFVRSIAPALGDDKVAEAFATGLVIAFAVSGFLTGYLYTRLRLQRLFVLADTGVLRRITAAVLTSVEKRSRADAEALTLVALQLDTEEDDPPEKDLQKAIAKAQRGVKVQVYQMARRQRRANWEAGDARMAATIPVFRALIAADPNEEFHAHFAQLGYALKDLKDPDLAGAEAALAKAVAIRDRLRVPGYRRYDFNLALTRIRLDPTTSGPTPDELRAKIVADLRHAALDREMADWIANTKTVQEWLSRNGLPGEAPFGAR